MTVSNQVGHGVSFRFKKNAAIGEPDAESDGKYLAACFVDTGDYDALADVEQPQRIIVGRTGAGKSALISYLRTDKDHVIEISPEDLSLNYLCNSDVIPKLEAAGVRLDIFYGLLWKHVLAVELLRRKYQLNTEERTSSWLSNFLERLRGRDQSKERAFRYLKDWGDKFWQETEYRIKEVTEKLESDIKAELGAKFGVFDTKASAGAKINAEQKIEAVNHAQRVVNSIQVKALSDVLHLLADEVFNDEQQAYYVVIDRLDEGWVEDSLRYKLIRALIEAIKTFRSVPSVKIVIALRYDLIQSVFDKTRDGGFQEEKYQALFLHLRWTPANLEQMLDKRISKLVSEQYTTRPVKLRELFPDSIGKARFVDYLFNRTLYRPRDAIAFVNECLRRSEGRGEVTVQTVREAEQEYSRQRLASLIHEWINHYPRLSEYFELLERMPGSFKFSSISKDKLEEFALKMAGNGDSERDPVAKAACAMLNGGSPHQMVVVWAKALYMTGVLGIKADSFNSPSWAYADMQIPTDGQIKPSSTAYVHQMLWARLGIREPSKF
ncbi:hypothetical protein HMPREF1004_00489 [Ralstonia pickettii]|nr:hypothetical protein HMPREF1004_00489 [Ralstonia pickettii]